MKTKGGFYNFMTGVIGSTCGRHMFGDFDSRRDYDMSFRTGKN